MKGTTGKGKVRQDPAATDKKWWHRHAERFSDQVTLDRARELYPPLFDSAGNLRPTDLVDFACADRQKAPARRSKAYQRHGVIGIAGHRKAALWQSGRTTSEGERVPGREPPKAGSG